MSDIHKPFNDDELRSLLNMGPFTLLMRENMPVFVSRWQATLDAERAHAAELQQRLDAQPYESESELVRLLAAREAEVVELREALEVAWGIIANAHGGDWSLASEQWQWAAARWRDDSWHAILSRAPGGNEALRALLERAWMAGAGTKASDFEDERPDQVCARDLARLLGPTGDGERKGAEG